MSNEINKISGWQEQQDRIDAIQKQMVDSKTFDAHVLKRTVDYTRKEELYKALEKSVKENTFNTDLIRNVQAYSNLLATDYDSDKPYSNKNFLSDLSKSVDGLKTGFKTLDRYITMLDFTCAVFSQSEKEHTPRTGCNIRNVVLSSKTMQLLYFS